MELEFSEQGSRQVARLPADLVLRTERDITDLVGNASFGGADAIVMTVDQLDPAFLELRSGLFGVLSQKLANYRLSLTVVGPLDHVTSESFRAFVRESNRGSQIRFSSTAPDDPN